MQQYKDYLKNILEFGEVRKERTGTGSIALFGERMCFDLRVGFPLPSLKHTSMLVTARELKWFMSGTQNAKELEEMGSTIWSPWALKQAVVFPKTLSNAERAQLYAEKKGMEINAAYAELGALEHGLALMEKEEIPKTSMITLAPEGSIGPMYGHQWRKWTGLVQNQGQLAVAEFDQITTLVKNLKENPFSRRHLISAWNVADLPDETQTPETNVMNGRMAIAPCHPFAQFYVSNDMELSCQVYLRSNDSIIGTPYNIPSYALFTHLLAAACGYGVGRLVYIVGDAHIYLNHMDAVQEMLKREVRPMPKLILPEGMDVFNFEPEEVAKSLTGYEPHPAIKGLPVAV